MKEQETDLEHPISKCNGNPFVAEKKSLTGIIRNVRKDNQKSLQRNEMHPLSPAADCRAIRNAQKNKFERKKLSHHSEAMDIKKKGIEIQWTSPPKYST